VKWGKQKWGGGRDNVIFQQGGKADGMGGGFFMIHALRSHYCCFNFAPFVEGNHDMMHACFFRVAKENILIYVCMLCYVYVNFIGQYCYSYMDY